MARKTVVAKTSAELNAEEYRADARKDAPHKARPAIDELGLMRPARERRADLGLLEPAELLKLAKSASRLELRGAMFSAEDRADCAAHIIVKLLEETSGAMPRAESPRVQLGRLCGDVKNYRRSVEAQRERDRLDAADRALKPEALNPGSDDTPARHAAIIGRSGAKLAARAADAIMGDLGLPADRESPAWTHFYQWVRGEEAATCAQECGVQWATWRQRQSRGAKFVAGFYSADELVARLTQGASTCRTIGTVGAEDARTVRGGSGREYTYGLDYGSVETAPRGELVYVVEDRSAEARSRTRMLAPDWRETGDRRYGAAQPRPAADVTAREMSKSEKVHWRRRRAHRADALTQLAEAHGRLAREYARSSRRERGVAPPAKRVPDAA